MPSCGSRRRTSPAASSSTTRRCGACGGSSNRLEYLRRVSGKRLTNDVDELRAIFDEFAEARRAQPGQWARHDKPTLAVAAKEAGHQITLTRRWAARESRPAPSQPDPENAE